MPTTSVTFTQTPLLAFTLGRADDALVLGHRLSQWCGHAPMLEEDIALANIALDHIGQARSLYGYAAQLAGAGLTEDDFAYLRDAGQYRNCLLVEQPNGDFAMTIARQFLFTAFIDPCWQALTRSSDATLAAIAAKAQKESAYHLRHCAEWLIRLGDGTDESHARAQGALDALWMFTGELFETDAATQACNDAGVAGDPASLRPLWNACVSGVLAQATLRRPADAWMQGGGRAGRHSEHLGLMLAELQYMQRSFPGAQW